MDGARQLEHLVVSGAHCDICDEPMLDQVDDVVLFPRLTCHLECFLRSVVGSVSHLKKECWCFGVETEFDPTETYREGAKKVLAYLLETGGRFKKTA